MKILRTPDERFANLPGYPFEPHYTEVPDGEGGQLRIHHVDEGPRDGEPVLCMHGQPTWSYLYRHMIPLLVDAGFRVLAPDLVGFGRSDKPAAREDYSYQRQVDWLTAWAVANDLQGVTFVGQDWGGLIGLRVVTENEDRFSRIVVANTALPVPPDDIPAAFVDAVKKYRESGPTPTFAEVTQALANPDPTRPERTFAAWQKLCWETEDLLISPMIGGMADGRRPSAEEIAAYDAPFPDPSYKMGPRAMPSQVPTLPDDPSIPANKRAWEVLSRWEKPLLCAFSDNDPVTAAAEPMFRERVPGAQGREHVRIQGGGHFLQEGRGQELAEAIIAFMRSS